MYAVQQRVGGKKINKICFYYVIYGWPELSSTWLRPIHMPHCVCVSGTLASILNSANYVPHQPMLLLTHQRDKGHETGGSSAVLF